MTHHDSQSGFSLVETLVAITILLVVIAGPLAISSSASKSSSFSSEQVVAFFLAQEGLELAQKARNDLLVPYFIDTNPDPNIFTPSNPDPWADFTRTTNTGLYRNCYTTVNASGCDLVIDNDSIGTIKTPVSCAIAADCLLYLDTTASNPRARYNHDKTKTATPYTRIITLELVNANEVKVTSKVTWRTGSIRQAQEVVAETRLFNIYGF